MLSQRSEKLREGLQKEEDYSGWLSRQASKLRGHRSDLDWDDIAEELEDMSSRERRELTSYLEQLLKHLLKWQFGANRRGASWRNYQSCAPRDSGPARGFPSLRGKLPDLLPKAYGRALSDAADEMKLNRQQAARLPESCPWTFEQFADADSWPERAKNSRDSESLSYAYPASSGTVRSAGRRR